MTNSIRTGGVVRARLAAAAAIGVLTVVLVGCSSSSSPTPLGTAALRAAPSRESGSSKATAAPSTADSGGNAGSAASSGAVHGAASITIKTFAYHVAGAVMPGATVRVTNDDSTTHTVTADSGDGFDVTVEPGKPATFTAPHAPGSYKFHCNFHADMHGTITVK